MSRDRTENDRRRISGHQRHVHDYRDQPGRRCICGQPETMLRGVGVRTQVQRRKLLTPAAQRAEDDIIAQLVRHHTRKEEEKQHGQEDQGATAERDCGPG